jgi:voltage-gated potassium channel Kch
VERPDPIAQLSGHVVVCNCNDRVRALVEELVAAGERKPFAVVLVVQDPELWRVRSDWHPRVDAGRFFVIEGSPSDAEVLSRARVEAARTAVILADPGLGELADSRTALIALAVERRNPAVHTVVELVRSVNRAHLAHSGVDDIVCGAIATEHMLAQSAVMPWIKNVFRHLLSSRPETAKIYLRRLPEKLVGRTFRELSRAAIAAGVPFVVCGYLRPVPAGEGENAMALPRCRSRQGGEYEVVLSPRANATPGKDTPLSPEDRLVLIGTDPPVLEGLTLPPR